MLPTIPLSSSVAVLDRSSKASCDVRVGDVCVFRNANPSRVDSYVCKRVGRKDNKGKVWLLGDNPGNSADSRVYGWVEERLWEGRVVGYFTWRGGWTKVERGGKKERGRGSKDGI